MSYIFFDKYCTGVNFLKYGQSNYYAIVIWLLFGCIKCILTHGTCYNSVIYRLIIIRLIDGLQWILHAASYFKIVHSNSDDYKELFDIFKRFFGTLITSASKHLCTCTPSTPITQNCLSYRFGHACCVPILKLPIKSWVHYQKYQYSTRSPRTCSNRY